MPAKPSTPQNDQKAVVDAALKDPVIARVMDAYGRIAPFVPAPIAPPVVKSEVATGANAAR
jgi:hypothetical protein